MSTEMRDRAFVRHVREVEGMVDRGVAFAEVEQRVADSGLQEDDQAALWLLAWSVLSDDGRYRRRGRPRLVPSAAGGVQ